METNATHAIVVDAQTRQVLLAKEASVPMHPSSMSKLMTLYVVFSQLKEGRLTTEQTLPVSEKAWRMQGSKMFVHVGDQVRVEDLIHGIATQSGNDACIVMAEGISGSEEAFATRMNEAAAKLGLKNSHFVNATGWPDEGQKMSAEDLELLSQALINDFPEYYPWLSLPSFTYNNITQPNRNRLMDRGIGVDGLKTGHTEIAGYGIAISAKDASGRRVNAVINGLPSDNARVEEGERLIRWAFREFENKTLAKAGEVVAEAKVWMGRAPTVKLTPATDMVVTLPVGKVAEAKYVLRYTGPVAAPIEKGQSIGTLVVSLPDAPEREIPLVAAEQVSKLGPFGRAWARFKALF